VGLAVRVIPTLLAKGTKLVKGKRFSADRIVGHVQQAAEVHQARGVDELVLLDVEATPKGRGPNFEMVRRITECCFMPLTVGGGVRSIEDMQRLLDAGADKVAVKTILDTDQDLVEKACKFFGCQAIVAALDVPVQHRAKARDAAIAEEDMGVGEILLTSIDREGTMEGYDLELIREVSQAVSIPVIAHGGCSGPSDMLRAIEAGASAVAAGALFQFTEWTPKACAQWLAEHGVETRV
jgi:cyclase